MKLTNNQIRQGSGELNWNILTQYSMARDDSNHLSSCTSPIKNNNLPGWDLGRNCWAAACRPAFSAHRSHQSNYWAPTKAAYVPVGATARPPVPSEPIWIESPSGLCPCVVSCVAWGMIRAGCPIKVGSSTLELSSCLFGQHNRIQIYFSSICIFVFTR